jgi:predicted  nucleic acid-binding Zn-ribbon protein
VANIENNLL